jgi:hypothetical protein
VAVIGTAAIIKNFKGSSSTLSTNDLVTEIKKKRKIIFRKFLDFSLFVSLIKFFFSKKQIKNFTIIIKQKQKILRIRLVQIIRYFSSKNELDIYWKLFISSVRLTCGRLVPAH